MKKIFAFPFFIFLISCSQPVVVEKLPFLGVGIVAGEDTIYPEVKDFSLINQDSLPVTNKDLEGKVYVADFIFLSCPSICPMMNLNLLRVYKKFEKQPDVFFLSHTIDPEHDRIAKLKQYSDNLNVSSKKWHFVWGEQDSIYALAEKSYFATAYKDSLAPGGYAHSGGFLLVDKNKHLRGVYDGTDSLETERLIREINILLKE